MASFLALEISDFPTLDGKLSLAFVLEVLCELNVKCASDILRPWMLIFYAVGVSVAVLVPVLLWAFRLDIMKKIEGLFTKSNSPPVGEVGNDENRGKDGTGGNDRTDGTEGNQDRRARSALSPV